jgi:4-diphosphocytidyl-2-C-methyl-D-erythritol kinase
MLHITGKKGDYHEMQSIFTFVPSWCDILKFDLNKKFSNKSAEIQGIHKKDNLIFKAREFLLDYKSKIFIPDVQVVKNIPIGAGLGGGSSDSACFINYVLDINKIDQDIKIDIAQKSHILGMDVPIFLHRYMFNSQFLLLEGIGKYEEIRPIKCKDEITISIFPGIHALSTKTVFSHYCCDFEKKQNIKECSISLLERSKNSLQSTAISLCPEISSSLKTIQNTGAIIYRVSGSGSACFGIYL